MTDLNNYKIENFNNDAKLIFLIEIEKLSPGYIDKVFIDPILNGDNLKKKMFFDILSTSSEQANNVYLLLKKLIDKNTSSELLNELLNEIKNKYFYKRISERFTKDEKIDNLIQNQAEKNVIKKYNKFYKDFPDAYGFNHPKELVLKNIKIQDFLKSGLKQLPLELFNQILEEYGLNVLKNFSFESLYQLMKISEEINGKNETSLSYNVIFNEKIKSFKEDRLSARQDYLGISETSFEYEDNQALCNIFNEYDKGDKDFALFSAWVNIAIITNNDSLMSLISKKYTKVLSENEFAIAMFESLVISSDFSNFKKILYRKNTNMFLDIESPIIKNNEKSLSKGMTILLAIDRNLTSVEHKTKEKIDEWKSTIKANHGRLLVKDVFQRNVFSEKENLRILEKHSIESINSFLSKYAPNVYNLKTFQEKIGLNDDILLGMLNLSVALTQTLNYDKNQVLKEKYNIFLFKDSFAVLKEVLDSSFIYENKEKVVESFIDGLLNKNSQIYLNYLLQGIALDLIPEKYKNIIYQKTSKDFGITLNPSESENNGLARIISKIDRENHYFAGLSKLNADKGVEEKLSDFVEAFKMRKELELNLLDDNIVIQSNSRNKTIKKF